METRPLLAVALSVSFVSAGCLFNAPGAHDGGDSDDSQLVCSACTQDSDCGGSEDLCLRNVRTDERFCGKHCDETADCSGAYVCASIDGDKQCVPQDATCKSGGTTGGTTGKTTGNSDGSSSCDPACESGEVCSGGSCVSKKNREDAQKYCVKVINELRARESKPPLDRSSELEECATQAAVSDAKSGEAHGHFSETRGCGGTARAENETPGWPLDHYGSVKKVIKKSAEQMFAEGPGGGHYENIVGDHSAVGCGIYVTDDREVWVVQDYR